MSQRINPDLDRVRTRERDELVFALYPTFTSVDELLRQVNALDGAPVDLSDLRLWALQLGVRRPHSGRSSAISRVRTTARDAAVRRLAPTMATDDDIMEAVNALPGPYALTRTYIPTYFAVLGVCRSAEYRAWHRASAEALEIPHTDPDEALFPQEIDYETAVAWGKRCGVRPVDDPIETLKAINKIRDRFRLPRFVARKASQDLAQKHKVWEYA